MHPNQFCRAVSVKWPFVKCVSIMFIALMGSGSKERQNEGAMYRKSDINSVSNERQRHEGWLGSG